MGGEGCLFDGCRLAFFRVLEREVESEKATFSNVINEANDEIGDRI